MPLKPTTYFIQKISANQSLAMFKPGCPYCTATKTLIEALAETGVVTDFSIFILDTDFTNETLLAVSEHFGWQPNGFQNYPSKPQVFIQGELIGGNLEFYKSKWNTGEGMPNMPNPM